MTIVFTGVAVLILAAIALVLYCSVVDGARRREYQDRVVSEWLWERERGKP